MDLKAFTRSGRRLASVSATLWLLSSPAWAQVESRPLEQLDLWSAAGRDTGLPADLWRGTSGELASAVLAQIAEKPLSPAMSRLARRMLAAGAAAPEGGGADSALAAARARALLALGDPNAALTILDRTPRVEASEALSRVRAEAALTLGQEAKACETGARLQENRDGAWWLKLRALCHAFAGETAAGQVTLDLWRQQGGKDAAFDRLAGAILSGSAPGKAAAGDALEYAASRRLKLDPAPALASAPPAVLIAVARDSETPQDARRDAVARALRLGLISAENVRALYTPPSAAGAPAVTDGAAPSNPAAPDYATLAKDTTARAEAALSTAAALTGDAAVRQAAVLALLRRAKSPVEFQAMARLVQPRIAELVQAGVALEDPVLFAAASAAAGDPATAQAIRAGIEQNTAPDSGPLELALLDALITTAARAPSGPVLDRLVERGALGDAKPKAKAQAAALLTAATGAPLSPGARAQLATFDVPAAKATPARLTALAMAADGKRPGEAALLALSIAAQQPAGLGVADRAAIVRALTAAGVTVEAAAIALEGLVALQRPEPAK